MKYNFLKTTFFCTLALFFSSGFTAIGIWIIQSFFKNHFGIECAKIWTVGPILSVLLGIIFPFLFYRHLKSLSSSKFEVIDLRLIVFNFFEFIFLQFGFVYFFEPVYTFCNSRDPQGPMSIIITAWIALPILIIISYLFGHFLNKNQV